MLRCHEHGILLAGNLAGSCVEGYRASTKDVKLEYTIAAVQNRNKDLEASLSSSQELTQSTLALITEMQVLIYHGSDFLPLPNSILLPCLEALERGCTTTTAKAECA